MYKRQGYVKHRHPIQRKRGVNSYTAEGRAMIHKQLEAVDMEILHYLMRNPVSYTHLDVYKRQAISRVNRGKTNRNKIQTTDF